MFNANFYPTPAKLISKMLEGIELYPLNNILEPSAGKGDIVDYIDRKVKSNRYNKVDIDTIEIEPELKLILKGKGYKVVHDDFLSYDSYKRYDLVVMNPPFDEGGKHLLKALELQQDGGRVICLLNAETLKNPHSNIRKDLVRKLEEYDAEVEFIENAFADAERKTNVEIALVKVYVPRGDKPSVIINNLKSDEVYRADDKENKITSGNKLESIIEKYNFEIRAGVNLITEYHAMQPYVLDSFLDNGTPIITLGIYGEKDLHGANNKVNAYVEQIRYKYWKTLFQSDAFGDLFTSNLRKQYHEKLDELKKYDFSMYNITEITQEVKSVMCSSIEDTIIALFDELSHKHSYYDETSNNIHYYNGWKTNKAWYINKKVIIKLNAFDSYYSKEYRCDYRVKEKLADIEKALNYLEGDLANHDYLWKTLEQAVNMEQTKKIPLKYFDVTFYKKGTCHIEFTNLDLLKKFNLFGSQRKNWLPPSYGNKQYENMNAEEKQVIDQFEGKESYTKTMQNKEYFIYKIGNLLVLNAG